MLTTYVDDDDDDGDDGTWEGFRKEQKQDALRGIAAAVTRNACLWGLQKICTEIPDRRGKKDRYVSSIILAEPRADERTRGGCL